MDTVRDRPEEALSRLTADDLAQVESIDDVSASPDGTLAYCLTAIDLEADRARSEWRLASSAGDPLPGGAEGRSPRWSPDGGQIACVCEQEDGALLRLHAPDGAPLRDLAPVSRSAGPPAWSPDGTRIAISGAEAPGPGARIAIVEVATGATELVPGGDGEDDVAPAFSPDGATLAFARAARDPGAGGPTSSILAVGAAGGEPRVVATGLSYATCPSWSPDGGSLACFGTREVRLGLEDPAMQPWVVPAEGGAARPAAAKVTGVIVRPAEGPVWSADGSRLHFKEARAGSIDLVEASPGRPARPRPLTAGSHVSAFCALAGGDRLAYAASTTVDPGGLHLVEAASGQASPLRSTGSLRGRVPALAHRSFRSPHGGALDGWVQGLRPGGGPQPLAVCMHGGPHSFVGTGFQGGHFHRAVLASRGWAVLTLNSSGSGSYGEEFADSIRGCWGERDLPEHLAAVDELVGEGLADPARLAVVGYSYGGYLAAWAICHTDRFRAAVIGAPIANLESFRRTSDIGAWYTPWEMAGTEAENQELFRRLSPVNHAGRAATPALILHGEDDLRCPIGQGEELEQRLAAAGAPVELVRYPGADHLFYSRGRPRQRLDYNRRIVEWLERWVPQR